MGGVLHLCCFAEMEEICGFLLQVNMDQAEEDSEIPQRQVFTGRKPFDFWHSLISLITSQPFIMAFNGRINHLQMEM